MKKVLITGAGGQLGQCFQKQAGKFPDLEFVFATSEMFDLTLTPVMDIYLRKHQFDYCINCAAYTNVEQAESNREMAFHVNADSVKHLARACRDNDVTLIHFSTDYVFDGCKKTLYSEEDETSPINIYGGSKLMGEESIQKEMEKYFIFRTSWLYSDIGHNFYNTIIKRAEAGEELNITTEQTGTPTNAYDLAEFVLRIIDQDSSEYGIYHYSNLGEATWYDFAAEILRLTGNSGKVELKENNSFVTVAKRPEYSVLSKDKTLRTFGQQILPWQESLAGLINRNH